MSEPYNQPFSLSKLRIDMQSAFDLGDIRILCFDLAIDYDELTGNKKSEIIVSLILEMGKMNSLMDLIDYLKEVRPQVNWQNPNQGIVLSNERPEEISLRQWSEVLKLTVPKMLEVPEGPFWFGIAPNDGAVSPTELSGRECYLPTFWIAQYPITCGQYSPFVIDTGRRAPWGTNIMKLPAMKKHHPVTNISLRDAKAYCQWLKIVSGREFALPTEEQWVKAARGSLPSKRRYIWGNQWKHNVANTKERNPIGPTSVHFFEDENRSNYNVCDLLGNVWEWTDFQNGTSHFPGQEKRALYGGSWKNDRHKARISARKIVTVNNRSRDIGFRVVINET